MFNSAARAGLILGGISILSSLVNWAAAKAEWLPAMLLSLLALFVWVAKFLLCIHAMRRCMLKYSAANPEADNRQVFRFGMLSALLSALVYSAYSMAYLMYIDPGQIEMAADLIRQMGMMDSASLELLEQMLPVMPTYTFFVNLIYCFLYGTVLAAIFSRSIPPRNPFADRSNMNSL